MSDFDDAESSTADEHKFSTHSLPSPHHLRHLNHGRRSSLQQISEHKLLDISELNATEINCDPTTSKPVFTITDESAMNTIHSVSDANGSTLDRPPQIDHYRLTVTQWHQIRPSMPILMHGGNSSSRTCKNDDQISRNSRRNSGVGGMEPFTLINSTKKKKEFTMNWFEGVYIPTFTNIVGTLLYLRMGFVCGQAGIIGGLGIVCFSTLIISLTALSLSAITSNGEIRKGGLYYVLSRALGPEFGGVVGVMFSLANIGMASLYVVGIAEFAVDLITEAGYGTVTSSKSYDIRFFSLLICAVLMLITFAGPKVENGFTLIFFSTYFLSYVNWIVGTFLPLTPYQSKRGVTGWSYTTFRMNLMPDFQVEHNFVTTFSIFFPGFTGMVAFKFSDSLIDLCLQLSSTMYAHQLSNPARDVPKGLFSAIVSTFIMYALAVIAAGSTIVRAADGIPEFDETTHFWRIPDCIANQTCTYGLNYFYQVADLTSAWTPLLICGMMGMTISSTMTNLSQGPLTFYAACEDGIFPSMRYFRSNIKRVYVVMSIITAAITCIGDLNELNEFVTNLFMATYVVVNYAVFDASFARTPGWRPNFPWYNMWISLISAIFCIAIMFLVSMASAILICLLFCCCLAYFHYVHPEVNWGDTQQAKMMRNALSSLQKLENSEIHVKNYRPQILLMSGNPAARNQLLDFAHSITKGDSLLMCAHVVPNLQSDRIISTLRTLNHEIEEWLQLNRLKAFYVNLANDLRPGMRNVMQTAGISKLKPNILMVGFKSNWMKLDRTKIDEIDDYVGVIRDAFESNYGVCIFRNGDNGFDLSELFMEHTNTNLLKRDESRIHVESEDKSISESDNLHEHLEPTHLIHRHVNQKLRTEVSGLRHRNSKKDGKPATSANQWMFVNEKNNLTTTTNQSRPWNLSYWTFGNRTYDANQTTTFDQTLSNKQTVASQSFVVDSRTLQTNLTNETTKQSAKTTNRKVHPRLNDIARFLTVTEEKRKQLTDRMNAFHRRKQGARIDVYWFSDDGGLTMLLPHLLRLPKSYLEGAQLRVITFTGGTSTVDEKSICELLEKFRIDVNSVNVIDLNRQKLNPDIVHRFNKLVEKWKVGSSTDLNANASDPRLITDEELALHRKRTYRQLLIHQTLTQHSSDANLIVCNFTIPAENVSSLLWLSWIQLMTDTLPPTLMVRGNQSSVLTFYS
ncbi:Solute carrier family 12 member 1 [Aphelenchoides besseyi]|nr:Solute carrier family 12 member 1 [Aphelenchoides besseyi]